VFTLDVSQTIAYKCYILILTTRIQFLYTLKWWRFYDTVIEKDMCLICSIVNLYVYMYIRLSVSVTCFLLFEALVEDWHVKRVASWNKVFISINFFYKMSITLFGCLFLINSSKSSYTCTLKCVQRKLWCACVRILKRYNFISINWNITFTKRYYFLL